ncbi:G8 domain-containing protein [Spongiivirga sp. MCCC 1A20706]|uniref:G8 domain-containing protein n=1 Tax=Spongiivirga sp. MCCC 1A20706 TaxID=3160963 RepID=UPI003977AB46
MIITKNHSLGRYFLFLFLITSSFTIAQQFWSNPTSWSSGNIPKAGENVLIPEGKVIILDVETPDLGSLQINGSLLFIDADVSLTAKWIMVHGLLQVGTELNPFNSNATITLTGPKEDMDGMGGRFLVTMAGGSLQLHGASRSKLSWGQIEGTVGPGATQFVLNNDPVGWEPGDKIAIAASGYEPYEAEELTITSITNRTISFTPALKYRHFGEMQQYEGKQLDERAEVALLTRNIKIQGASDSNELKFGGHTMIMSQSGPINIEGVEFTRMGQPGIEARYNLHWHLAGDRQGDYIKNSSIHHSMQRGVVVHQTDNVLVENVAAYNIQNHVFVPAEDGNEINNTFKGNLAMLVRRPDEGLFAFPRDGGGGSSQGEQRVAGFWMRNVHNNIIGNHVAGSERGTGFFFDTRGRSRDFKDFDLLPREVVFQDNLAHSCSVPGNLGNEGVSNVALYGQVGHGHGLFMTKFNNGDLMWTFKNFTSYKNAMSGVWTEITNLTLDNFMVADNAIGLLSSQSFVQNSVVVGKSANDIGGPNRNLRHGDKRAGFYSIAQGGFKQPKFTNVTFIDINKDIEADKVAAAVVGNTGHFGENFFQGIAIKGNTLPVWMSTRGSKGKNENSSFLLDKDGSLTGYNKPVLIAHPNSSFYKDAFEYRDDWQAYIVDAQYAMELKMNGVGFDLEQEVSLIRDFDRHRIPKMQRAHQRFFKFFGQQQYTIIGQWDFDDRGQSLELFSALRKEAEWSIFKHPFPYTNIRVEDREEQLIQEVNSVEELRSQQQTSYYFDVDRGALYVKMITDEEGKDWVNLIPIGEKTGANYGIDADSADRFFLNMSVTPNPLTNESALTYTLLQDKTVSIGLYDILGRKVKDILNEEQESGDYRISLDGIPVQSGMYILNVSLSEVSIPFKVMKK